MNSDQIRRHRERAKQHRDELYAILDAVPYGTLSTVVDGRPWVVPMLFARDGDRLLLHGSTGAGALRQVAAGAPAAFSVLLLDGVVVAASTFDSSANYRSAVVHGLLTPLTGDDQYAALDRLSENILPGRTDEVRPMTDKELRATLAVQLQITDGAWTAKQRTGGPSDDEDAPQVWQGVVPVRLAFGEPLVAPQTAPGVPVPESVARLVADGWGT